MESKDATTQKQDNNILKLQAATGLELLGYRFFVVKLPIFPWPMILSYSCFDIVLNSFLFR